MVRWWEKTYTAETVCLYSTPYTFINNEPTTNSRHCQATAKVPARETSLPPHPPRPPPPLLPLPPSLQIVTADNEKARKKEEEKRGASPLGKKGTGRQLGRHGKRGGSHLKRKRSSVSLISTLRAEAVVLFLLLYPRMHETCYLLPSSFPFHPSVLRPPSPLPL